MFDAAELDGVDEEASFPSEEALEARVDLLVGLVAVLRRNAIAKGTLEEKAGQVQNSSNVLLIDVGEPGLVDAMNRALTLNLIVAGSIEAAVEHGHTSEWMHLEKWRLWVMMRTTSFENLEALDEGGGRLAIEVVGGLVEAMMRGRRQVAEPRTTLAF
ncbi:hypothetical protein NMY22_g18663 [Coprinellus aureogranulatus]|nr:hypothetical protein NMY22_g18663 [Coprinellus aureogranulatus]